MTKSLLTFLLTSMLTANAFGQSDKDEIKKTFKEYFKTVAQKDNAKTLGYIYPTLFDLFPKDKMLQAMDKMKADTSTRITMEKDSVTSISETLELDGIKYALLKYSFKMTMTILATGDESDSEGEEDTNPADFTYEMLKEKYGEKNVVYDRAHSKLDIYASNEMYAIHNPSYKSWKFLEKKESMNPPWKSCYPKRY